MVWTQWGPGIRVPPGLGPGQHRQLVPQLLDDGTPEGKAATEFGFCVEHGRRRFKECLRQKGDGSDELVCTPEFECKKKKGKEGWGPDKKPKAQPFLCKEDETWR